MKIKRKEPQLLLEGIKLYDKQVEKHLRLTLLFVENKPAIRKAVSTIEELKETFLPSAEMAELQRKKDELSRKYWKKDEDGNYVMEEKGGQNIHVITNMPEVIGKIETLNDQHKELIGRYVEGEAKIIELLEEEITLPLKKITNPEWLKFLSPKSLSLLAPIIGCTISEKLLEQKGDSLNTSDLERIFEYCKVK